MGTRVEQSGKFVPRASGTGHRHLEDMADSLYRLPSAAEDLQVIIPRRNRTLLLQGEFRITLDVSHSVTARVLTSRILGAVNALVFQRREERLGHRIVVTDPGTACRLPEGVHSRGL